MTENRRLTYSTKGNPEIIAAYKRITLWIEKKTEGMATKKLKKEVKRIEKEWLEKISNVKTSGWKGRH